MSHFKAQRRIYLAKCRSCLDLLFRAVPSPLTSRCASKIISMNFSLFLLLFPLVLMVSSAWENKMIKRRWASRLCESSSKKLLFQNNPTISLLIFLVFLSSFLHFRNEHLFIYIKSLLLTITPMVHFYNALIVLCYTILIPFNVISTISSECPMYQKESQEHVYIYFNKTTDMSTL